MTGPDHQLVTNLAPLNQASGNAISIHSPLGLLDLPPEVRLIIFRHLLVKPHGVPLCLCTGRPGFFLAILLTSRLIQREAFAVYYKENHFAHCFLSASLSLEQFPRVIETMRNVSIQITGWNMFKRPLEMRKFLNFMLYFGNPSIIRGTLVVALSFYRPSVAPLKWYIRALGRFTNFGIIELELTCCLMMHIRSIMIGRRVKALCEYLRTALEPVLGPAEVFAFNRCGCGRFRLRFHPIDHRNPRRERVDRDWMDCLDGIRLEWNENVTNPDDSTTRA